MTEGRHFEAAGAPHLPPSTTVAGVMRQVLLALVPGILAHAWYFGPGIFVQILLCCGFGLAFEAVLLRLRQRPLALFLSDWSAVVTGVLLALCLPPLAPWWVAATGMLFAIVLAKQLYGGLGFNLFNPAMVGFAAVIIAFPIEMSHWLTPRSLANEVPGLLDSLRAIFLGQPPVAAGWDAVTQATPLDALRTGVQEGLRIPEIRDSAIFGDFGGLGWEWIANWYAVGGLWLLYRRIISWHVPVAVLATVILVATPVWLFGPDTNPSPLQHVFSGALVLCAFFIATDPVSGPASLRGKLVFGAGIALLTLAIRRFGAFPDGVAFAVLLMNMLVPLIDRYTRPRAYGHPK
ncbi:RnfABCDGE type electron transport complex subunit D [Wenzhouxiangella marina]|uniref:Ion-translocating oxidoreductase complex subunit D n=1 Tax=Wenzhouxiangella marina TaxID=1579979 RepID=A0A0K0XVF7_9GAMM|nr:RnfABCDGE type electron transport complex subunit D [Wenzhouxiangella marina]AKS41663.1 electron transporter RnfG [Wenzhouxiangella marina]MBB6086576.1 electron transport complex protein RnfD [Wenzhouxiangella marina]